ncbi:SOS response-associated peptidase [Roseomonas sp. HJA6]|uniref:Abasic site processing protein n=1 Tax=Roseomonas alba TaxID=2846776 RepID=A0ABS7ABR2_9PROT|nr:SOS response-associated peptidase [Neoroseomonas alba]MBW6399623.1 SOS response-associated peptidase [Neoroseomonas alba]
MCGRYFQQRSSGEMARHFGVTGALPNLPPSFNRAPTQEGLVVRRHPDTAARHLDALRWGLVPRWAKDATGAARMINARSESVAEKPAFRDAFHKRRGIAVADGFYEWQVLGKGSKQPFAVAMADGAPMPLAALWEGWRAPDGTILRSYTILTTAAVPELAPLHERMPVILPPEAWDAWLGDVPADEDVLLGLLKPYPRSGLAVWPVGARVGRVSEDDAGLLDRDPLAVPPPGLDDPPPRFER